MTSKIPKRAPDRLRRTTWWSAATAVGALAAVVAAGPVRGAETSVSGFASLGYARSDRAYDYQRSISDDGTLKRDSVLGLQLDTRIGREFGVTLQGRLAASDRSEDGSRFSLTWGFVSWRPSNDWLLRAGKFRAPLYLNSETSDVGVTFDLARLPAEVYSQSPTDDFTGLSASRSWNLNDGELVLDGYWGSADTRLRLWAGDGLPPVFAPGAQYLPLTVRLRGIAATLRQGDNTLRIGYSRARADSRTPELFTQRYPFVPVPGLPGVGFYLPMDDPNLGSLPMVDRLSIPLITAGVDIVPMASLRVVAEIGRRIVKDTELGYDTLGGYVAVLRPVGAWTPYLAMATLRSTGRNLSVYRSIRDNRVPDVVPGAAAINASQVAAAAFMPVFDQRSLALGTSYALSPRLKLKAEIQGVRIGEVSALADAPPGVDLRRSNLTVISVSLHTVF